MAEEDGASSPPPNTGLDEETWHTGMIDEAGQPARARGDDITVFPDDASPGQSAQPASVSLAGKAMIGRYALLDELGRGGMGVVYRAHDTQLDRVVALKVMLSGSQARDSEKQRFLREARAAARLEHENIVQIHDIGEHDGRAFFTMPLIDGPTLSQRIARGPTEPERAASLCAALARALHHAHSHGLVHRDVKPGNVLVERESGKPILTDFGLVKNLDAETAGLTRAGQVMGTPAYMAPEQLRGEPGAATQALDQFSVGVILYELVSGARPFASATPVDVLRRALDAEQPHWKGSRLPAALQRICSKAMAHDPAQRYPACQALADDLERFVRGEPVAASRPGFWHRATRAARRHKRWLVPVSLAVVAAVLAVWLQGTWAAWQGERASEARAVAAEHRRVAMEARVDALFAEDRAGEAEQVFTAFIDFPDNAETEALALAWLNRGARLAARREDDGALEAYASAYAVTASPTDQVRALVAIAEIFRRQYAWAQLRSVLRTLETALPRMVDDPRAVALRRDLLLSERKLAQAAALTSDAAEKKFLAILGHATATRHRAHRASPWDIDHDGRSELILQDDETSPRLRVVSTASPDLPLCAELELPGPVDSFAGVAEIVTRPGEAPLALFAAVPRWFLVRLAGSRLEEVASWPKQHNRFAVASGDLDGDGIVEHYVTRDRELARLVSDGHGSWSLVGASATTNQADSEVRDLLLADVDGDGAVELLAATGGWNSYDVRLFRPGARELRLVQRHRLGEVDQLALIATARGARVAALQSHDPTQPLNRRLFSGDEPQGEAQGIHILTLARGGLRTERVIPLPPGQLEARGRGEGERAWPGTFLHAGDLDGDGLGDLVLASDYTSTFIYHQRSDGSFAELALDGVIPLAVANLDSDADDELLVAMADDTQKVWVLGAGEDSLPALATDVDMPAIAAAPAGRSSPWDASAPAGRSSPWDASAPDAPDEPWLAARWRRAEDLVALGLARAAADRFEALARLAAGTPTEGQALYRAGQILAAEASQAAGEMVFHGMHWTQRHKEAMADAGALFERAARWPDLAARAWEGAFASYRVDRRLDRAARAARERLALPAPPSGFVALARAVADDLAEKPTVLDLRAGLDPRWQIDVPCNVRREPGGLRIQSVAPGKALAGPSGASSSALLHLLLRPTGGRQRIAVSLEVVEFQWASTFTVRLAGEGMAGGRDLRLQYHGGSGVYFGTVYCPLSPVTVELGSARDFIERPLEIAWEYADDEGSGSCSVQGIAQPQRVVFTADARMPAQGLVTLSIDMRYDPQVPTEVILRQIELHGFEVVDPPNSPIEEVNHELAVGRPERALAILDTMSGLKSVLVVMLARAMALEELGRRPDAIAALGAALARDAELDGLLGGLFQHQLDRYEPLLRAVLRAAYYVRFWQYEEDTVTMNEDELATSELLVQKLVGLENLPLTTFRTAREARAHLWLLARRGGALRRIGSTVAARRHLDRARALAAHLLASPLASDPVLRGEIGRAVACACRELAVLHLQRDERDAAMTDLLAALEASPAPEVFADELVVRPELQRLHTHPEWQRIERARRYTLDQGLPGGASDRPTPVKTKTAN